VDEFRRFLCFGSSRKASPACTAPSAGLSGLLRSVAKDAYVPLAWRGGQARSRRTWWTASFGRSLTASGCSRFPGTYASCLPRTQSSKPICSLCSRGRCLAGNVCRAGDSKIRNGQTGSVTFIQRFGGIANMNPRSSRTASSFRTGTAFSPAAPSDRRRNPDDLRATRKASRTDCGAENRAGPAPMRR